MLDIVDFVHKVEGFLRDHYSKMAVTGTQHAEPEATLMLYDEENEELAIGSFSPTGLTIRDAGVHPEWG